MKRFYLKHHLHSHILGQSKSTPEVVRKWTLPKCMDIEGKQIWVNDAKAPQV